MASWWTEESASADSASSHGSQAAAPTQQGAAVPSQRSGSPPFHSPPAKPVLSLSPSKLHLQQEEQQRPEEDSGSVGDSHADDGDNSDDDNEREAGEILDSAHVLDTAGDGAQPSAPGDSFMDYLDMDNMGPPVDMESLDSPNDLPRDSESAENRVDRVADAGRMTTDLTAASATSSLSVHHHVDSESHLLRQRHHDAVSVSQLTKSVAGHRDDEGSGGELFEESGKPSVTEATRAAPSSHDSVYGELSGKRSTAILSDKVPTAQELKMSADLDKVDQLPASQINQWQEKIVLNLLATIKAPLFRLMRVGSQGGSESAMHFPLLQELSQNAAQSLPSHAASEVPSTAVASSADAAMPFGRPRDPRKAAASASKTNQAMTAEAYMDVVTPSPDIVPPVPFTFTVNDQLKLSVARVREEFPQFRAVLESAQSVVTL